jgi:hypothetical protein
MTILHSTNAATDNVQEPKKEAPLNKEAYRAPRLVTLGTAVGLTQYRSLGGYMETHRGSYYNR